MFYAIYKITNLSNGRYYVGSHMTENLNDGYMGSGNLIKRAIRKYGKVTFKKEYLFFAFDKNDMNWAEEQLVTIRAADAKSYNITRGGNRPPIAVKRNKVFINDGSDNKLHDPKLPTPEGWRLGMYKSGYTNSGATGKWRRTKSAVDKMVKNRTGKGTGSNNAMASQVNRNKVAASKLGRKRIYNADGSFTMTPRV